jgi:hypothetical protein
MQDSYLGSWKQLYLQTLLESDPQKLTELVLASEQAMAARARQLLSSSDQREERSELAIAKASLLSIKAHKLGWPSVPSSGGLH